MIKLSIAENFWESSLFIFILSICSGIIGYYIKHYIDKKRSKNVKILSLELIVGMKYTNGKNVIPTLGIKLENLSKVDVSINYVALKSQKRGGMATFDLEPISDKNLIKTYEIKKFNYKIGKTTLRINPITKSIQEEVRTLIQSPEEFFSILFKHLSPKSKPIKNQKDFENQLKHLGVYIHTNIGTYFRKFNKKERKMFFEKTMLKQYELQNLNQNNQTKNSIQ